MPGTGWRSGAWILRGGLLFADRKMDILSLLAGRCYNPGRKQKKPA